jgi:nucleoside-diphosphate-sugar epimerase
VRENDPLPPKPVNEYARTKLLAERAIDQAHGEGLPVITIRPRAIFGPGDTTILPRLIDRLESGRLPIVGNGKNIADLSYIDNVVDALLLCAESPDTTLGKKYNITNGEPVMMWEMIHKLTHALGIPFPTQRVPHRIVEGAAGAMEVIYWLIPGQPEPPLTRYSVAVICRSTTLDISAARHDLGYVPRVSIEEGFERFVAWWKSR